MIYVIPKYEIYHEIIKKSYVISLTGSKLDERVLRLWVIPVKVKLWFVLRWLEVKLWWLKGRLA